jgi:hypothetical protein
MLIKSAQTMAFDDSASEQTVILKSTLPYTGIRISLKSSGAAADADGILGLVQTLVVDQPKHGSRSRRVDVSGDTVYTLPFMAQLGAGDAVDANSSTSATLARGDDATADATHFYIDIPCFQAPTDPDARITIKAAAITSGTLDVSFAFLDRAFKDVYFRAYSTTSVASHQQFFPADGVLRGIVIASHASNVIDARGNEVSQISLNSEQQYTYTDAHLLGPNYDQVVLGGGQTNAFALDIYAMLENFPLLTGRQNFVQIDRSTASEMYVIGVMSDA